MTFDDFKPYPLKETLIKAFSLTQNVMLKLPKNQDVNRLIEEIKECYVASMTPEEKLDPLPLPTTFILFQEGKYAKFYLILTGLLVEYDYNVLIDRYLKKQKASPVAQLSTAPTTSSSIPNPERISEGPSHRKVSMQSTTAPSVTIPPPSLPVNKKNKQTDDEYGEEVQPTTKSKK